MEPLEYIAAASAALALVEKLMPIIDKEVAKGNVPADVQQKLKTQADDLHDHLEEKFAGDHWQID